MTNFEHNFKVLVYKFDLENNIKNNSVKIILFRMMQQKLMKKYLFVKKLAYVQKIVYFYSLK